MNPKTQTELSSCRPTTTAKAALTTKVRLTPTRVAAYQPWSSAIEDLEETVCSEDAEVKTEMSERADQIVNFMTEVVKVVGNNAATAGVVT